MHQMEMQDPKLVLADACGPEVCVSERPLFQCENRPRRSRATQENLLCLNYSTVFKLTGFVGRNLIRESQKRKGVSHVCFLRFSGPENVLTTVITIMVPLNELDTYHCGLFCVHGGGSAHAMRLVC